MSLIENRAELERYLNKNIHTVLGVRMLEIDIAGGNLEAAARLCEELRAEFPRHPMVAFLRGELANAKGDIEVAREAYVQTLRIDPQFLAAYRHLAELAESADEREEAAAFYQKVLEIEPDDAECRACLEALATEVSAEALESVEAQIVQTYGEAPAPVEEAAEEMVGAATEAEVTPDVEEVEEVPQEVATREEELDVESAEAEEETAPATTEETAQEPPAEGEDEEGATAPNAVESEIQAILEETVESSGAEDAEASKREVDEEEELSAEGDVEESVTVDAGGEETTGVAEEPPVGEGNGRLVEEVIGEVREQPLEQEEISEEKPEPSEPEHPPSEQAAKITRNIATFTLADIYQSQGQYAEALEVLDVLAEKGEDLETIKERRRQIEELSKQSADRSKADPPADGPEERDSDEPQPALPSTDTDRENVGGA